jgi:hypothetical protein
LTIRDRFVIVFDGFTVGHGLSLWGKKNMIVEEKPASWLRNAGSAHVAEILEHGKRVVATLYDEWCFAIVSIRDLRALSALAKIRPELISRLLIKASSLEERKAIVRLLDWLESEDRIEIRDGEDS